ncbi:PREDICTED: nucleoprotein TPR-like isoform X2 [Dinoponera quadriceps]|uniref:Nucleoprotein TPR n=1 Tax=Dinoponera quadriceps TaxID=609295 RepID=A0A6P3YEE1_DINQU|nr:PREDICTED: nucleoprotein TPR-like isoform X2 [Dinoponera quadriceps]
METVEKNELDVLREIASDEELAQIPAELAKKIHSHFTAKCDEFITAKAVFESNRKNLEQNLEKAQKELAEHKVNLDECRGKLELAEKYSAESSSSLEETRNEVYKLKESVQKLEKENGELRRHRDTITDDRNALQLQVERRDTEIARMYTELSSLGTQLQAAIAAKCQVLAETEEIHSLKMTLDFKEKRLEQERVLLAQQLAGLEEELAKRNSELQTTRSEASARALLTDTKLTQREEELRIANEANSQLRESVSSLQKRSDELAQKLEEQRIHEISMHNSYREEIGAQTRLADLYKSMADEANSKADEFSNAVKELQELLEHASEQYGILETKHNQLVLQHKQDIDDKEQNIQELTKELDNANELLKNIQQERLDQAVEQLAPTAAITSRVLRKGLSLTQIYTQLVEVTDQLTQERQENERLKSQMDVILCELQQKAPLLQQQRQDYEAAISNIEILTCKQDELLAENQRLVESSNEAKRLANHHSKENQKLKVELSDLARQVCYLLKEVQESRAGVESRDSSSRDTSFDTDNIVSSQIISKKLVTFKDIEELQENNQKLLAVVRALSSRQEEIERATDEINSGEMKEKLDRYMEQLADMQAAQDRQSKMLDNLLKQRDMYKNMYQQRLKNSTNDKKEMMEVEDEEGKSRTKEDSKATKDNKDEEREKEWSKKLKEVEDKLKQVSDEYEMYRKERTAHEKMLSEEVERLRKEAEANSARCCRLKAQLDSANERFTLLQGNVSSYKTQIKALEDKCNNYNVTIGKHEQSIMILKDETLAAQSRLSRAEVQLENLRHERQLLRDSEGRLLKEREVYQRERQTQVLLKADMESIKASLERVQAEGQLRAEQRFDDANRECAALRRRLQEEQDRFRDLAAHLERQLATNQERLKEERELNERLRKEVEQSKQNEHESSQKVEELGNKLKQMVANYIEKPLTGDENLVKRVKELEVQLDACQTEIKSLTEQLRTARQQSQQYCDIAESAETQLRELSAEYNKCKDELTKTSKDSRVEIISLQKRVKELGDDLTKISNGKQETDSELREKLANAESKVEELDELKGEIELLKSDLKSTAIAAKEAEEKYAREMVLHSADLQVLAKLKEDTQQVQQRFNTLTQERNVAIEALKAEKSAFQEMEKKLMNEIEESQKRIEDLDTQNVLLHNQIQELGNRAAIMQSQQTKIGGRESPDTSLEAVNKSFSSVGDEDSNSVEQLLRVMKYLRREKDLALAKSDVLRAENLRLKSQADVVEKRLKESEALLNSEREKAEIDVVTTSKHAELLRKVETLNAITDSNRILREERDSLSAKVNELVAKVNALSEEVVPLRDISRDLTAKTEVLTEENTSLKNEATRWRQRANTLLERANKLSPEDWRRLQTERENLSKLLTSERETHAKRTDEYNQMKTEKAKLDEQLAQLQKQLQTQGEELTRMSEEVRKLSQDLNESLADSTSKAKDLASLRKELSDKEVILNDIKNKEIQIRKIAKKYKTQFEELTKTVEEEKKSNEEARNEEAANANAQEREEQLREEGRQELRQANIELTAKTDELTRQITMAQSEAENLRKEIETLNRSIVEKEERAKQVLKGARTKIMQLTESKKTCEKELLDLKSRMDSAGGSTGVQADPEAEHDNRLTALKSQMDGRISRLEHEKAEVQAEKEALLQRVTQLQRQLSGVSGVSATTEPPTANIKPMSARAETPLASIRPMSMVQSRTAAVLPTTASAPVMVAPHQMQQQQQQVVHTTETSSPTSSLTDFQPASTSSSSQGAQTSSLRQLVVQPQLSESAESTQREDPESVETLSVQPQQQQCQQQQQQQTVALVSPRVEQQQQQQQQQVVVSDQQQTVASSSTQSVSTSQASTGLKRPRGLDSTASGSGIVEGVDHGRQEQAQSPKTKRSRQDMSATASASASEVEYQVPTSSQRDQDEEVEEGCVVVVDCDEGEGGGNHQAQEEEEFDNDPYEEMEEEEEMPYEVEVEVERDNNEVEIIMEEDSTSVEVPRQTQAAIPSNQQQSEAISSAGPTGEPPTSFTARSSRGIAPMPRQQQQQHLLLPQQGYEDGGDDCIVPSTPTLFVPRRSDGFGEAVSSPQVPQGRFTFGDPSAPTTASSTPSLTTPTGSTTRTIFGSSSSAVAQVVQESLDDSRMDLAQLEDGGTGRSVPTTPLQVSPAADLPPSTSSGQPEEQETTVSVTPVSVTATSGDNAEEPSIPSIRIVGADDQQRGSTEATESSVMPSEGVSSDGEKRSEEPVALASGDDDAVDTAEVTEESASELVEDDVEEESREAEASPSSNTRQRTLAASLAAASASNSNRGVTVRRSPRSPFRAARGARPTPIVWGESQSGRGQAVIRGGQHATRGAANEGGGRGRGTRGRRMRSKYPYARYS